MILNWKKFSEGKQLDLFDKTNWEKPELVWKDMYPMTPTQIEDDLVDLDDGGYNIDINYGFFDDNSFTKNVGTKNKRDWLPCIQLIITKPSFEKRKGSSEDFTTTLQWFIESKSPKFSKIVVKDWGDESILNYKDVKIEGGFFVDDGEGGDFEINGLQVEMIWFKPVYFTDKMIIEYHGLDFKTDITYDEKEQAYLTYPAEKYAYWLISTKDDYYDILADKNGFEALWERYWDYSDRIDVETLFRYHLNIDTVKLLVDLLIDDFEQIKEVDEDEYETLTEVGITSKEQLIERAQKVGLINIGNLLEKFDEDYISEISSMWTDMGVSATVDKLQDKIVSALEEVIQNQLETNVTKTEWKDGIPYLTMRFKLDWLERYEGQDELLGYIIQEYISNNYLDDNRLRVYMDYMEDADSVEFNRDVKLMAIRGIERKGRKPITGLEKT